MQLPTTRLAALQFYKQVEIDTKACGGDAWYEAERWLGRNDLFYLMVRLLRRPDVNKDWLFERCREVQEKPDGYLDLWAREHGKSSIITFGKTIQDIICDAEITIGIFSHTRPVAKAFLRQIKVEFEGNEWLKHLFPDVLWEAPHKQSPKWSEDDGIVVKRTGNPKEATVEAWGLVDGQPTGRHFRLRVYDDVVTRESVTTPEQIEKTTRAWELSDNLGVQSDQGGVARHIGTRYCLPMNTLILMADWSHRPISQVRAGDDVIGWELRDGKRWLVFTKVLHAGMHPAQSVKRYTFNNGRSVVCTEDHKWWRGAQWSSFGKDSASARAGRCNGHEYSALGWGYHQLKHIRQLLVPTTQSESRDAAWLAGFFDGEGTIQKNKNHPSAAVVFIQSEKNRRLIDHCHAALERLHFSHRSWIGGGSKDNPCHHIYVNGGWRERYRFLAEVSPVRNEKLSKSLFGQMMTERFKLTDIEDAGIADVYWIETGTGNYIADGFCSKNSLFDSYATMLERNAVIPRIYPATHNGRFDGAPVLFSDDEWARRLRTQSRSTVAAQLLQNPLADEDATFRTEWLRAYEIRPRTLNVYIMCDPSKGRLATSDNTAIAVIGISATGGKYLIDGACHRMTLSQRWQMLRTLYHRWSEMPGVQHVSVGYERYGAQSDDEYFREQMEMEQRRRVPNAMFVIHELNWPREGGNSKKERVERLEPDFRNGRFFLPAPVLHNGVPSLWRVETNPESRTFGEIEFREKKGMTRAEEAAMEGGSPELLARALIVRDPSLPGPKGQGGRYDLTLKLFDEYKTFPFGRFDDLIDAASRIYDMDPHPPAQTMGVGEMRAYMDGV